jgi:hypothetical protein
MVQTTLHYACRDGDMELVKNIIEGKNGHVSLHAKRFLFCHDEERKL